MRILGASGLGCAVALAALASGTGSACYPSAPANPTWIDDVRPLLVANCIRCHGAPALGGAPPSFRLDRFEDTGNLDGSVTRGAATMAEYIAQRAGVLGEMPPDGPARTDVQRETLIRWWDQAPLGELPARGARANNREPTIVLVEPVGAGVDDQGLDFFYEISDADGDLVTGELTASSASANAYLASNLVSGRGRVFVDTGALPDGEWEFSAQLYDDTSASPAAVALASVTIVHGSGNTAPTVLVVTPNIDDLIAGPDLPYTVSAFVRDPDEGDTLTVDFEAFRGADTVAIAQNVPVDEDELAQAPWDPGGQGLADAPNWRVRAIASDGTDQRTAVSAPFILSGQTTTLTFAAVRPIFDAQCTRCHPGKGIPGVPDSFIGHAGVHARRGSIYRRVVEMRNMPPESAHGFFPDDPVMSQAERVTLAEWLLAGAPE
jgi:hypothetical protein